MNKEAKITVIICNGGGGGGMQTLLELYLTFPVLPCPLAQTDTNSGSRLVVGL